MQKSDILVWREERFVSFFSSGFITAIVVNPTERKLAKRISVQCSDFLLVTQGQIAVVTANQISDF